MDSTDGDTNKASENKEMTDVSSHFQIFDEPDDELEEFDEIENIVTVDDPEIADWNEDWETAGWDDEDAESDFVKKILQELENYRKSHNNN
ncbi:uncharacterized protein TA07700 [Theileria annulata]|uniref:Uncharacterized protein n=1 Tax=Theileria annulata TaxID=5874 RepID=Q4UA10_THEAN|nr:uncharacterized protein TA07700 [Theileria annulata]CAI76343.1 hypothetical protein, conserved [Theileria annulata]|eukprot:XP_952967.1 hypothetical protein, conserved [Theileria annulata]